MTITPPQPLHTTTLQHPCFGVVKIKCFENIFLTYFVSSVLPIATVYGHKSKVITFFGECGRNPPIHVQHRKSVKLVLYGISTADETVIDTGTYYVTAK